MTQETRQPVECACCGKSVEKCSDCGLSEADAAAAYRTAAKSHYGEFHRHEIGEVNAPANH